MRLLMMVDVMRRGLNGGGRVTAPSSGGVLRRRGRLRRLPLLLRVVGRVRRYPAQLAVVTASAADAAHRWKRRRRRRRHIGKRLNGPFM